MSNAVKELKDELSLEFNQKVTNLTSDVHTLHAEISSLKSEFVAMRENLKADLLIDMRDIDSRNKNVMILGLEEFLDPES